MVQPRGGASFLQKALNEVLVSREHLGEHLQCNDALERHVLRAINFSHASGAELFEDLVAAEPLARKALFGQGKAEFTRPRAS
jgi:hypothetical protein